MRILPLLLLSILFLSACRGRGGPDAAEGVTSRLNGSVTVRAEADTARDYQGFELIVRGEGETDTLGYAVTDRAGAFEMTVRAPARGIYPLVIARNGRVLGVAELAVAEGDTATLRAQLPLQGRMVRIVSRENGAWMAYKNTKAVHSQDIYALVSAGAAGRSELERLVTRTANLLWGLQDTYPGTMGAELGQAESVNFLTGWNDSLVVARAREIRPGSLGYVEAARAARGAAARLEGQQAAIRLLEDFRSRAERAEQRAAIQAEIVQARLDSLQREEAVAAARTLREEHPGSQWVTWSERAEYEAQHLLPGLEAPGFTGTTREGRSFRLDSLRGRAVLLEFWHPENSVYQQQVPQVEQLRARLRPLPIELVSVSLAADTTLNNAFLEGRRLPGIQVYAPDGLYSPAAQAYNVHLVPTRFLIDREGKIYGKYLGNVLGALEADVLRMLQDAGAAPPAAARTY